MGIFAWRCTSDPSLPFVVQDDAAPWVSYPLPPVGVVTAAPKDDLPVTTFSRSFEAPEAGPGRLQIRALRGFVMRLNGETLPAAPLGKHWKTYHETPVQLVKGSNELEVWVVNPTGPGLLSLRLEGPAGLTVVSDADLRATYPGRTGRPARRIGGAEVNPNAFTMPGPREGWAARWTIVLAGFVLGGLLFVGTTGSVPGTALLARTGRWLPAAVVLMWLPLLVRAAGIPLTVGFDQRQTTETDLRERLGIRGYDHLRIIGDAHLDATV